MAAHVRSHTEANRIMEVLLYPRNYIEAFVMRKYGAHNLLMLDDLLGIAYEEAVEFAHSWNPRDANETINLPEGLSQKQAFSWLGSNYFIYVLRQRIRSAIYLVLLNKANPFSDIETQDGERIGFDDITSLVSRAIREYDGYVKDVRSPSAMCYLENRELFRQVLSRSQELPETDRLVMNRLFEGKSQAEIARELGVTRAAVGQRVKRLRRELSPFKQKETSNE